MQTLNEIKSTFEKYNYVMRTSDLRASRVYYEDIQRLLNDGIIEKIKQGYYHFIDDQNNSEANIINRLFPDAIMCMHTALFYYKYSDRTPSEWHLAVDKDIPKSRVKIDYPFIKAYFIESRLLNLGVTTGDIDSITICIYDRDRTICDCLRYINKMDKEIFNKAIQSYVNDVKKNIPNLMKYSKLLRVQEKVKNMIGVWL